MSDATDDTDDWDWVAPKPTRRVLLEMHPMGTHELLRKQRAALEAAEHLAQASLQAAQREAAERTRLQAALLAVVDQLAFVWTRIETNKHGCLERNERGWHATFDYEELEPMRAALQAVGREEE